MGVDPLDRQIDPRLGLFQDGDEVGDGAPRGRPREGLTRDRLERAKHLPLATAAVIELLRGRPGAGHVTELVAREARRR
jgi:hypothetical protein